MKRKYSIKVFLITAIIATAGGLLISKTWLWEKQDASAMERPGYALVNIDDVVKHPERYTSPLRMTGVILSVDKNGGSFIMGCDDACIRLPVIYKGKIPNAGSAITIFGKIKKTERGQYFFDAERIEQK